jgi:hypothetical protein
VNPDIPSLYGFSLVKMSFPYYDISKKSLDGIWATARPHLTKYSTLMTKEPKGSGWFLDFS